MQNDPYKQDEVERYVQMAMEEQQKNQELMKGKTSQDEPTSKKQGPANGFQIYWKGIKENHTEEEQSQLKEEMNEPNLFKAARKKWKKIKDTKEGEKHKDISRKTEEEKGRIRNRNRPRTKEKDTSWHRNRRKIQRSKWRRNDPACSV